MRFAITTLLVLLGGCVTPVHEPITTQESPAPTADAENDLVFSGSGCLQYHGYFAANKVDFESFLPEGFAIEANDAGTFDLRIEATQCSAPDGTTMQLWIELPVVPPADLAVAGHGHLLPIEVYASSDELRSTLENAGVPFVVGCHCAVTTLATEPLIVDEIVSHSLSGVYELRASLSPSSGAFEDEKWARYIADDGEIVSILRVRTTDAQNRGAGAVAFHYSGPGGAPPGHAGIIHSVSALTLEIRSTTRAMQQNL